MSIDELYRTIRAQVRQLGHRDSLYVIWAYSLYLQVSEYELPNDIEAANQFLNANPPQTILAEWTLEQIAREVIRHADEEPRKGQTLKRWAPLAQIGNTLRDLEGQIYAELVGGNRIQLELLRIAHRQFVWQQQRFGWRWIIRYYKLFNTPAITELAKRATGLTIDQIYLIGMAYLGIFFGNPRATRQINIEIPGLEQQHIDHFLAFTSCSRATLGNRLRAEHTLDEGFVYRYSSLREFPLVAISYLGKDEIACPIPTLLFWRITTGLYYSLKDQIGFPTAFGKSFQSYIGEILQHRITNDAMTVLPEAEYHVGRNRKDTIDWIIQQGEEAALFIECKTMRLTWASKAGLSDLTALEQDIRKLAGAIVQVYKTIQDYKADRYPQLNFVETRHIYPAVITLEDWYFFGVELPARLDTAVRTAMENAALPVAWIDDMPYSIMSVHEFEKASGVINTAEIHPFISGKVGNPELRRWAYGAYCNDRYPEIVRRLPVLFRDEFDAMFSELEP
jgi:hypothetical protein